MYRNHNLQIIFGVTLIGVMGVSLITPAFPQMMSSLRISKENIGFLITAFTLPGVLLTPLVGVLADRFGRKRVLVPSLFLFGLAGGACGFIDDFKTLLFLRLCQGIGGSGLISLATTLIGDLFYGSQRLEAMGWNASILSIGAAASPFIGGAMALLGWYYPFLLFPLAILIGLLTLFYLENPELAEKKRFKGYLLQTFTALGTSKTIILFLTGIVTFILLFGVYLTYFPLLLAENFSASPFTIGFLMSFMSVVTAAVSSQLGKITKKFSRPSLLGTSFLFFGVSLFLMPWVGGIFWFLFPLLTLGIAQGLNLPALQMMVAEVAPTEYRAIILSLYGTVIRLGQTLGPILTGIVLRISELKITFWVASGISLLAFLTLYGLKGPLLKKGG